MNSNNYNDNNQTRRETIIESIYIYVPVRYTGDATVT